MKPASEVTECYRIADHKGTASIKPWLSIFHPFVNCWPTMLFYFQSYQMVSLRVGNKIPIRWKKILRLGKKIPSFGTKISKAWIQCPRISWQLWFLILQCPRISWTMRGLRIGSSYAGKGIWKHWCGADCHESSARRGVGEEKEHYVRLTAWA